MLRVTQQSRQPVYGTKYPCKEQRAQHTHHLHSHRKYLRHIATLFVGEAEEGRLHSKGKHHKQQRRPCIYVSNNTILPRLHTHLGSVERHKQIVEETPHNTAQSINYRIFKKRLQLRHILKKFRLNIIPLGKLPQNHYIPGNFTDTLKFTLYTLILRYKYRYKRARNMKLVSIFFTASEVYIRDLSQI